MWNFRNWVLIVLPFLEMRRSNTHNNTRGLSEVRWRHGAFKLSIMRLVRSNKSWRQFMELLLPNVSWRKIPFSISEFFIEVWSFRGHIENWNSRNQKVGFFLTIMRCSLFICFDLFRRTFTCRNFIIWVNLKEWSMSSCHARFWVKRLHEKEWHL